MNDNTSTSGIIEPENSASLPHFSDYEELPCNGFNRLFKAKRYGRWYVLKGLKPEYASQQVYHNLLHKEFELMAQLSHPSVVTVFSLEQDSVVGECIVMEYIDGCTLSDLLTTKINTALRRSLVRELLEALQYVHSKQIVHRDLKPSNILVARNGNHIKLIDFGLSDSDSHAILKQPAGSREYAAPEQLSNDVKIDCRADIYAFGKILHRLFPHRYRRIVRKCTQHNREKRYASAVAILNEFERRRKALDAMMLLSIAAAFAAPSFIFARKYRYSQEQQAHTVDTVVVHSVDTVTRVKMVEKQVEGFTSEQQQIVDEAVAHVEHIYQVRIDSVQNGYFICREQGYQVRHSATQETYAYRERVLSQIDITSLFYQQLLNVMICNEYEFSKKLTKAIDQLPPLNQLHDDSLITDKEYLQLLKALKP